MRCTPDDRLPLGIGSTQAGGLCTPDAQGNTVLSGAALTNLGLTALYQGQYAPARGQFQESLILSQEVGDQVGIADDLEGLAGVAAGQGDAPRLWGAAEALRAVLGAPQAPAVRAKFAPMVEAAQAQVAPAAWAQAWAEGQAMPLEQAVAYALEGTLGD